MKKKETKEIKLDQLRIAPELMEVQHLMPIEQGDYDNLKADITENGIRDSLKVYYKDRFYYVIAGMNRLKIAKEARIKSLPVDIYNGSPEEYRDIAIKDNLNRRHLNTAQKRKLAEYFIKQDPEASARSIAEKSGITDKTAGRIKAKLQTGAEIPHLETVKGADGKTYKAESKTEKIKTPEPKHSAIRKRTPEQSIIADIDLMISRITGMKKEFIEYDIDSKKRTKLLNESLKALTDIYGDMKHFQVKPNESDKDTPQHQTDKKKTYY